jgi:hypothetical protein
MVQYCTFLNLFHISDVSDGTFSILFTYLSAGLALITIALTVSSFNMAYLIRVLTNFFYAICTVGILIIPRFQDVWDEKGGRPGRRARMLGATSRSIGIIHVSGLDFDDARSSTSFSVSDRAN